jgi:hypothetical protein
MHKMDTAYTETATMARPKSGRKDSDRASDPRTPAPPREGIRTLGFRVSIEYADWLNEAARANRTAVADLIDQALAAYVRTLSGFSKPPPPRLP